MKQRSVKSKIDDAYLSGINYILSQHPDYPLDYHVMPIEVQGNIIEAKGNIFQRALITENVLAASHTVVGPLKTICKENSWYIVRNRDADGWRYFPGFQYLPPDADTLAQITRVLREYEYLLVEPFCRLEASRREDGGFNTWLAYTPEERQAFAHHGFLEGSDSEVVANVLYTMKELNEQGFAFHLDRGNRFLKGKQKPDGHWDSTWYRGPFYGTYAALRFLRDEQAQLRAQKFLHEVKKPHEPYGDELQTSLALLTHRYAYTPLPEREWKDHVFPSANRESVDYLLETQQADGSWPARVFIESQLYAKDKPPFGSATVTTSFAIRALISEKGLLE